MSFKKNKYSVIKGAISKELAQFCHTYFLNKRRVARFLFDHKYISTFTEYFGIWNGRQTCGLQVRKICKSKMQTR